MPPGKVRYYNKIKKTVIEMLHILLFIRVKLNCVMHVYVCLLVFSYIIIIQHEKSEAVIL